MWHDHEVEGLLRENDALRSLDAAWPIAVAALCIWREARGEPYGSKVAIARVLKERARDPRWPNTLDAIALQPLQFSSFNSGDPNAVRFPMRGTAEWRAFEECWRAVLDEAPSPVDGANHYHDISIKPPAWTAKMRRLGQIGKLIFYKG